MATYQTIATPGRVGTPLATAWSCYACRSNCVRYTSNEDEAYFRGWWCPQCRRRYQVALDHGCYTIVQYPPGCVPMEFQ